MTYYFGSASFGGGYCRPSFSFKPAYSCPTPVYVKPVCFPSYSVITYQPVKPVIYYYVKPALPKLVIFDFKKLTDCLKTIFDCLPKPKPLPKPDPKPAEPECKDCENVDGKNPDNQFGGKDNNPGNVIDKPVTDEEGKIYGTDEKDTITGTDGEDDIWAKDGADVIHGGKGNDTVHGEGGGDTIYGDSGKDYLNGGTGNDYLNGGPGDDIMRGGDGNDVYLVQQAGDVVLEDGNLNGGIDTVRSFIDYTLPANVENLILMSDKDLNGTGNELDNVITGNSGSNEISGLAGNDTLYGKGGDDVLNGGEGNDYLDGGSGQDTLNGGSGNDTYFFDVCYNKDTIIDNGGNDVLKFGESIKASDLGFSVSGQDLVIAVKNAGTADDDAVVVKNWFAGAENQIETFEFSSQSWNSSQIQQAIQEQTQSNGII